MLGIISLELQLRFRNRYLKFGHIKLDVADYGYDFNFLDDRKTYIHRTFDIFRIAFSYLDSATPKIFLETFKELIDRVSQTPTELIDRV